MTDNIIEFILKEKVYVLEFNTPPTIRMKKSEDCNIMLELEKLPYNDLGTGTAWVPAKSKEQAIRKLLDLLNATHIKVVEDKT